MLAQTAARKRSTSTLFQNDDVAFDCSCLRHVYELYDYKKLAGHAQHGPLTWIGNFTFASLSESGKVRRCLRTCECPLLS